uniref:RxLR effector protein n=1 Tax=Plectus sambesii TaxID=2011161 RepID=A0A914WZI0_9BILA
MRSPHLILIAAVSCFSWLGSCQTGHQRTSIRTDKSRDRDALHSSQNLNDLAAAAANGQSNEELELDQRLYDALDGVDRARTTGASLVEPMRVYTAAEMPRKTGPRNGHAYDATAQFHTADDGDFRQGFEENFKPHDLCDWWNSGQQNDELTWSESADRILRVIGNGVVKNGYNMFLVPGQTAGISFIHFLIQYL